MSSILSSRPATFTTFNSSGAVENGFNPATLSPISTAPIGFLNAGFTHGSVSNVSSANGRFIAPGVSGSFEFLVKNSNLPSATSDIVLSFGGSGELNVVRRAAGGGSEYTLTATSPSGSATARLYTSLIPSLDYVALTITNDSFELYVNGFTVSLAKPLDMPVLTSYSARGDASKLIYFSVIRENTMPQEYHDDIYSMIASSFSPLAVEGFYNATTFIMDHELIVVKDEFELTDMPQPVYTAEPTDSFTMMPTPSETGMYDVTVGTTRFTGVDVPILGTYNEITAPDEAFSALEGSELKLLGSAATLVSTNMPDRTATVNPATFFSWTDILPVAYGSIVINPDVSATVAAEYPTAYSMWVYLPTTTPGTIVSGGAISLSVSAGAITRAGMSQIYVDGVAGVTTITAGWHHISFIPTTQQNDPLTLASTSAAVYSFSMLYAASPSTYLVAMYNAYNNPPKVVGTETGSIVITEQAPVVYDNKWSIKSVD